MAPALSVPVTLPLALTSSEPVVSVVGVVSMSSSVPPVKVPVAPNVAVPVCHVEPWRALSTRCRYTRQGPARLLEVKNPAGGLGVTRDISTMPGAPTADASVTPTMRSRLAVVPVASVVIRVTKPASVPVTAFSTPPAPSVAQLNVWRLPGTRCARTVPSARSRSASLQPFGASGSWWKVIVPFTHVASPAEAGGGGGTALLGVSSW